MNDRGMDRQPSAQRAVIVGALLVAVVALLLVVVLVGTLDAADILRKAGAIGEKTGMPGVDNAVNELKGPVTAGVGATGTVGAGFGAILVACGSPKGMKVAGCSAGGLGVLAAAHGFIA